MPYPQTFYIFKLYPFTLLFTSNIIKFLIYQITMQSSYNRSPPLISSSLPHKINFSYKSLHNQPITNQPQLNSQIQNPNLSPYLLKNLNTINEQRQSIVMTHHNSIIKGQRTGSRLNENEGSSENVGKSGQQKQQMSYNIKKYEQKSNRSSGWCCFGEQKQQSRNYIKHGARICS